MNCQYSEVTDRNAYFFNTTTARKTMSELKKFFINFEIVIFVQISLNFNLFLFFNFSLIFESHKTWVSLCHNYNVRNHCFDPCRDSRRERQVIQSCAWYKCAGAGRSHANDMVGPDQCMNMVIVMKYDCSSMSVRNAFMLYMHASELTHDIAKLI